MRALSAALLLYGYTVSLSAACSDLLISEYVEGSSCNKAIELYNPTGEAVDLSAYVLELYSNGSAVPTQSAALSGSLAPEAVFVVSRSDADAQIVAVTDLEAGSVINFNGDDAVVVRKAGGVADVFGLMEIENDGYDATSALADLVDGLNEAAGSGTFGCVDAIKVALIYNRKRVAAVGKPHAVVLDAHGKNRPSLIQSFRRRGVHGKAVAVSVNHLKSKGSPCDGLTYEGVSDTDRSDGVGNCNLTRTHAVRTLTAYVKENPYLKRQDLLFLGDFNAYAMEDPVRAMEDAGYTNVLAQRKGTDAYTYVFDGESGTLDYAFAGTGLNRKITSVTVWHSNTDEPIALDYNVNYKTGEQTESFYGSGPFRASDHDPVIVDFEL